jgi:hypothetical protein
MATSCAWFAVEPPVWSGQALAGVVPGLAGAVVLGAAVVGATVVGAPLGVRLAVGAAVVGAMLG